MVKFSSIVNLLFPLIAILAEAKVTKKDLLRNGHQFEQIGQTRRQNDFFLIYPGNDCTNELKSLSLIIWTFSFYHWSSTW